MALRKELIPGDKISVAIIIVTIKMIIIFGQGFLDLNLTFVLGEMDMLLKFTPCLRLVASVLGPGWGKSMERAPFTAQGFLSC